MNRIGRAAGRWAAVGCIAAMMVAAGPVSAFDGGEESSARFLFDRVEIGGGWSRQHCDEPGGAVRATIHSQGFRVRKDLSHVMYVGFDFGSVDRSGSSHPVLGDGLTGALEFGLNDQDVAWSGGVTLDPSKGFPRVNGSARIGRDDLYLSASYARSLPVFSSDDVDVGMGAGFADGSLIWIGASMPINRDVVGVKAMATVRPTSRIELVGAGRYGNSEAGRIEGFSVSLAYVNPSGPERTPQGAWGRFLSREPGQLEYIGAGGIVGAVGGVMAAGAAVQRPCGDAAFRPAVIGALLGGLLGAVFGNAVW